MSTDALEMALRLDALTRAMLDLTRAIGPRIDRDALAQRMGIHRNTLRQRLNTDPRFPRPGTDGRWLLSEVIEWELSQLGRKV